MLLSFASCKSIEKMVAKGDYEQAFDYAIEKLSNPKNRKTEYVTALEKAYSKLNANSLKEISKLDAENKPENWSKVLLQYKNIERRQDMIDHLLPLTSKTGYTAHFDIKNYSDEVRLAEDKTCSYYYGHALNLIGESETTGNKMPARMAYDELKRLDVIKKGYKDSDALKNKALNLGVSYIRLDVSNNMYSFHSEVVEDYIWDMNVSTFDDLWHQFSVNSDKNADYIIVVDLDRMSIGTGFERSNNYTESKEILVKKEKVKEIIDSVEVWKEKEVFARVSAEVREVFREKKSELHGSITLIDRASNRRLSSTPINVYEDFKGYGCDFRGDEEALTKQSKDKIDRFLEMFPSDRDVSNSLSNAFVCAVKSEIDRMDIQ